MWAKLRWFVAVGMILALPLVAQDKGDDKKTDAKDKVEKKAAPPSDDKKKSAPPAINKYQSIGKISGKLLKVDTEEMTVELEVVVPTKRSAKIDKQTHSIADDYKVRMLNLPERLDDKGKAIPYGDVEKTKLRGDNPKLPGYTSQLSALKSGQVIEIELSTKKPQQGAPKKKIEEPETPVITMIIINKEAPKTPEKKK